MKKKIFMFVLAFLLIATTIFLAGCSNEENTQEVGSETENQVSEIATNNEENSVIQVGDHTLEYGTYIDKYSTTYILNEDGTYSCESTELPDKSGTGTYQVFYFESSMWNIEEIRLSSRNR